MSTPTKKTHTAVGCTHHTKSTPPPFVGRFSSFCLISNQLESQPCLSLLSLRASFGLGHHSLLTLAQT